MAVARHSPRGRMFLATGMALTLRTSLTSALLTGMCRKYLSIASDKATIILAGSTAGGYGR